jgi:nicotinamide riboside kinase
MEEQDSTARSGADGQSDGGTDRIQRVVFLGAESTGKSTLCDYLAHQYGSVAVPEIGRYIWEEKEGELTAEDYVDIALRHREAEDEQLPYARRYLFVDTNALTTLLLGLEFGQVIEPVPPALLRCADECRERYAYTFVCADDIPYEEQAAREDEAWRGRIHELVLKDLDARGIAYTLVQGSVEERALQVRRVLEGVA